MHCSFNHPYVCKFEVILNNMLQFLVPFLGIMLIRTGGLSKSTIKFETGWNLPPVLKIVTCPAQLHVDQPLLLST